MPQMQQINQTIQPQLQSPGKFEYRVLPGVYTAEEVAEITRSFFKKEIPFT